AEKLNLTMERIMRRKNDETPLSNLTARRPVDLSLSGHRNFNPSRHAHLQHPGTSRKQLDSHLRSVLRVGVQNSKRWRALLRPAVPYVICRLSRSARANFEWPHHAQSAGRRCF